MSTLLAAAIALLLAMLCAFAPGVAWAEPNEGAVELGLSVGKQTLSPDAGEEASVDLGLRLGLDTAGAPVNVPGSGEALLGIAVGYDRVVEEGYTIRLDAGEGTAATDRLVLRPDRAYEEDKTGTVPEPAGITYDAALHGAARAGYVFKGWCWDADGEGPADFWDGTDGSATKLSYSEMRARDGQTLHARWELAQCARVRLDGASGPAASPHDGAAFLWYWPGRGYTPVDPAVDLQDAEASLAASADDAVALVYEALPYPSYAAQYFTGWAPVADGGPADRVLACEKGAAGYGFSMLGSAFDQGLVDKLVAAAEAGVDAVWYPVYETAQISVSAPFKVTFKARSDGNAADTAELKQLADDNDIDALNAIFSEPFTAADIEALLSSADRFVQSPQRFTNTSASACDVYISSVECSNVAASMLLPGGSLGAPVFSLAPGPARAVPVDRAATIRFGYAGGTAKATVGRDEPAEAKIVLPRPVRGEDGSVTYEPRILWYGLDLAASGFATDMIAFGGGGGDNGASGDSGVSSSGASSSADQASYIATLANVKYTYSVAL